MLTPPLLSLFPPGLQLTVEPALLRFPSSRTKVPQLSLLRWCQTSAWTSVLT